MPSLTDRARNFRVGAGAFTDILTGENSLEARRRGQQSEARFQNDLLKAALKSQEFQGRKDVLGLAQPPAPEAKQPIKMEVLT